MKNISVCEDVENEEQALESPAQSMKYICVLEIRLPKHGICSRGVGTAEDQLESKEDPLEYVTKLGKVQKFAAQKAVSDAFQKILFVILDNGKLAVEYRSPQGEALDCLTDEELQGLIEVNELSWSQEGQREEEVLSDLSFNTDTLE
nr:PREDICTED: RAD52 motif-containing protein 1-like [Latimeria chalumnae]|eukprot:XP_006000380.2 PREDICTED: RAD52 motif-containing protein 1-like [Latimeria chalumnae]